MVPGVVDGQSGSLEEIALTVSLAPGRPGGVGLLRRMGTGIDRTSLAQLAPDLGKLLFEPAGKALHILSQERPHLQGVHHRLALEVVVGDHVALGT